MLRMNRGSYMPPYLECLACLDYRYDPKNHRIASSIKANAIRDDRCDLDVASLSTYEPISDLPYRHGNIELQ